MLGGKGSGRRRRLPLKESRPEENRASSDVWVSFDSWRRRRRRELRGERLRPVGSQPTRANAANGVNGEPK